MSDHVQSLVRGLAVIRTFSGDTPSQTLSEVARGADLPRATARRLLLTLEDQGYVESRNGRFQLTARILDLSQAFLSSLSLPRVALPHLESLVERVNESSSVAILSDTEIVYVARVPTKRIMTVSIGLGTRFAAYQTSIGRVLLAELDDLQVRDIYERSDRTRVTSHTVKSADDLLDRVAEARDQGWAMVDQELEVGLRSLAAPIRGQSGTTIAAVNVSTHVGRTDMSELKAVFLPALIETANTISEALALHPIDH